MRIHSLYVDGFGKLRDLSLSFSDGLNVIYGQNEAGKSTLHRFQRAMLYGLGKHPGGSPRQDLHRFRPWDGGAFGGTLEFSYDGSSYLLKRDFSDGVGAPELFLLAENGSTEVLPEPQALLDIALGQLSENSYRNTVSIGQLKSAAGREMVQELRRYLESLESSGSAGLRASSVLARLAAEKRKCQDKLVSEASKSYSLLIGEIRNTERELADPRYHNLLLHYRTLQRDSEAERTALQQKKEMLLQETAQAREALRSAGFLEETALKAALQDSEQLYRSYTEMTTRTAAQHGPALLLRKLLSAFIADKTGKSRKELTERLEAILQGQLGEHTISEDTMQQLRQRFRTLEGSFAALREKEEALRLLSEDLKRSTEEMQDYTQALHEQHMLRTEVEGRMQHLSNIRNRVEQLAHVLSENKRLAQRIDALDLAMETISLLSERVRLSFGHYLNEEAGRLIERITDGAYRSVWIDDQLHILLRTEHGEIPLESVSSGTIDQIYLALRLATARLLLRDARERLPLTLDDSFAFYDENRLRAALHFIREEYDGQILLYTCHRREQQLFRRAKEDFRLLELG